MNVDELKTQVTQISIEVTQSSQPIMDVINDPGFEVRTPDDLHAIGECLRSVKGRAKDLEERRTRITRPLLDAKRAVDDLFSAPMAMLAGLEYRLKSLIAGFHSKELAKQQLAMEAAASLARAATDRSQVVAALQEAAGAAVSKTEGITVRQVWTFEVSDAGAVPREFLVVDSKRILAAISSGTRAIPGVKIFQTASVSARSS